MCNLHLNDVPKSSNKVWHPDDETKPTPARPNSSELYRPDILQTIEARIEELDKELRELSLDIHGAYDKRQKPVAS